jgi:hypothetical protein
MNQLTGAYHSEFLLARLQKPQCSEASLSRIEGRRYSSRLAQPSLRYFTQKKIAEDAYSLRRP